MVSPTSSPTSSGLLAPADRLVTLPPGAPRLTLGYGVAHWMERWLVQPNGPRARKPFRLVDSQLRFLAWWYAVDESGHWLFHHGVRRLAKGSGKSPFAAALALAELCGPVRLDDFDPRIPGGCRGRRMDMPWVQIAATAESQTANTMRMVRAFAPKGSEIVKHFQLDPGKTIYYAVPEGKLEVITSSSTAAEGAEASFVIADETEHWKPSNGGPELARTLADNLAKSGSRMLETSNAWVPGTGSVAEISWDAWVAQEEGRTRPDARILYDARMAPPEVTAWSDDEELRAGLEQVYGDCFWVDLRAIMARIRDLRSDPEDSRRKYLNRPTVSSGAWMDPQDWARCTDASRVVADSDPIALFFDGSKSDDATGLVGCDIATGHVFVLGCWEKPLGPEGQGWQVDRADVDRTVRAVHAVRNVVAFFADVKEFESYIDAWAQEFGDRYVIDAKGGRERHAVAWDMRTNVRDFTAAAERFKVDVQAGDLTHDGDARLARHIANAVQAPNKWGVSVSKESRESPRKIDLAVCAIGARMVRRLVLASPNWANRDKQAGKQPGIARGWGW